MSCHCKAPRALRGIGAIEIFVIIIIIIIIIIIMYVSVNLEKLWTDFDPVFTIRTGIVRAWL